MKIDIGCGVACKEGFDGIDIRNHGQKYVFDAKSVFPFEDNSVEEVYSRNFIICLTNYNGKLERVSFFNELYRIMKNNATATIIVPSWNSAGGYGDPEYHEPLYEASLFFLSKKWREDTNNRHSGYRCDFEATWGYNMHPNIASRNTEYQQFALANYSNSATEIMITLKKKASTEVIIKSFGEAANESS